VPIYTYKGYDAATGAVRKGQEDGDSPKAVKAKLRLKKIIVSEIKEEASAKKSRASVSMFSQKVKAQDVAVMTRQFATLQNAHVPLDECLKAL
jgi:general secretion pathway protein F